MTYLKSQTEAHEEVGSHRDNAGIAGEHRVETVQPDGEKGDARRRNEPGGSLRFYSK